MRNPFENWFTGDDSLSEPGEPHELAGVLRMHRAGWTYQQICKVLFMSRFTLAYQLKLAEDDEKEAIRLNLPIYDGQRKKEEEQP